jgi:hypothetical protein
MPVAHEKLSILKVEGLLRSRNYGFVRMQGGWMQLNKPSATATRQDGTPRRDPLPGIISPAVLERILTYSDNVESAAAHIIAMATQQVTDPVIHSEPVQAPQMDLNQMERVAQSIVENKLAEVSQAIRAESQKKLEEMAQENQKLREELQKASQTQVQAKPAKEKKGRTPAQLANDERLRQKAAAERAQRSKPPIEVPTDDLT